MTPLRTGKLFALASVEIDIDGMQIAVHNVRALNAAGSTRIELPQFRDQSGAVRPAITLPEEVRGPIGDAVIDELVERGLARRRFDVRPYQRPADKPDYHVELRRPRGGGITR